MQPLIKNKTLLLFGSCTGIPLQLKRFDLASKLYCTEPNMKLLWETQNLQLKFNPIYSSIVKIQLNNIKLLVHSMELKIKYLCRNGYSYSNCTEETCQFQHYYKYRQIIQYFKQTVVFLYQIIH